MAFDKDFGKRVKAARGYAGGISRGELAHRIGTSFPGVQASEKTIQRLEEGHPSVKGSMIQWAQWIAAATGYPATLLEADFEDAPSMKAKEDRLEQAVTELTEATKLIASTTGQIEAERRDAPLLQETITSALRALPTGLSLDALLKALAGAQISSEDNARIQEWLHDPEFNQRLQDARAAGVSIWSNQDPMFRVLSEDAIARVTKERNTGATRRSAVDEPLPGPPGELGRRAREHLPSTGDREQPPSQEEPGSRRATGG